MGIKDVMTRRQARKTNYEEACKILQEKNVLVEEEVEIENKNDINCLDKTDISYGELVELAKKHHLNYKGSREELCERLKNIGYKFRDDINILEII